MKKLTEIMQGQGALGAVYDAGKRLAVEEGKKYAINKGTDFVTDQIDRLVTKNKSGINKLLKVLGLDKGGDSNIYDKVAGRADPLLDFEFLVYMPTVSTPWASAPALDPYWIEDIDVPVETFDTDQMKVNGHPVNVMMYSSQGEVTLNIYADYTNQAQNYINQWYSSVRTRNGRYNLPYAANNAGYKKMIQILIMKGNMHCAIVSLSGVMPTGRTGHSFKSAGSDRLVIPQTFSVDKVYMELLSAFDPTKQSVQGAGTIGGAISSNAIGHLSNQVSKSIRGF